MENLTSEATAQIISNNIVIAKFMGWKPSVTEGPNGINLLYLPNDETGEYNYNCEQMNVESMKYHNSWDWIMGVVEKIESLTDSKITNAYWFEIGPGFILLHSHPQIVNVPDFEIRVKNNKLSAVYNAVIKFIEWYNSQEK